MTIFNKSSLFDKRELLLERNKLKRCLQAMFDAQNFIEVETPILQLSPGNETHLHAFKTQIISNDLSETALYLHTSPEFAMKKLVACGEKRIYQFARVFRNRERGKIHHPEFTMLEWYRASETYEALMHDCSAIIALSSPILRHKGHEVDTQKAALRISYAKAFKDHAAIDIEKGDLKAQALAQGYRISSDDNNADISSKILTQSIEPAFAALNCITILDRYPIEEAALARPCQDDPRYAERFEVYACGVELANAFGELTDAEVQRARFKADMVEKQRLYGESYPLDEELLEALTHLPPTSGAALGFDRLAMLATNAPSIDHLLWWSVNHVDE